MALEPLQLDDLTWSGMAVAIRQRIAPASAGLWTLHAAVDPGITLLELYAWMLEQRLFWLDQVPDEMVRGALTLLGLAPNAARSAGTVFHLTVPPGGLGGAAVPARSEFVLASPGATLVFTTLRDLTLLGSDVKVSAASRDITTDLASQRPVELFTGSPADLVIEWTLAGPPAAGYAAVLLRLLTSTNIAPQWEALGRFAQDPSTVLWQYSGAGGAWNSFTAGLHDGTAGFRRSGVVRFPVPTDWTAPYRLRALVTDYGFSSPPRLAAVLPDAEIVRNRRVVTHELRVDWLPLPGNQLDLSSLPDNAVLKDVPVMERSIYLQLMERDGQWHRWKYRADFAGAGPADRVFTFDNARSTVVFGNGIAGRIPAIGAMPGNNVRVAYHVGGGSAGNVPSAGSWVSRSRDLNGAPLWTAGNPVDAGAGADEEPLSQARTRAGAFVREANRAILRDDFETLAVTTPNAGIARAHAAVGYHPCYPCDRVPGAVTVFIVPDVPRPALEDASDEAGFTFVPAPAPDAGQLAAVAGRLEARRLVGSEVYVRPPLYRAVGVILEVSAAVARYDELKQRLKLAMRGELDPLGGVAGNLADAYPFGQAIRPTSLRRVAQQSLGRDGDVLTVRVGIDGNPPQDVCGDIAIGPHELVYLASFDLALKPARTRQGGLR